MNTAHKLLIIIAAFVFTGCISSQALYFHERTKFGFSVQAKPEDPQEKLATHLGFKRQIIAIVPPKLVSKRTRNEIDGKPHTDETEGDKYHEGEALSLVSTFDVTANALKSIHIHNNFASGQAAKNLVDVSNEVYQDSKNVEAFRKFIADKKAEAKAAQNAGSSVVAPVRSDGFAPPAAAGKITEANYQKPYGHQLLLTKGRVTYEDKFAQTTTPLTAKEKEKDTCLNKLLSDEGKDCAMTWLGELAKNNKMDFIEALPIVENAKAKDKNACLKTVREQTQKCGETLLTELALQNETKITNGLNKVVADIREAKKKGIASLLEHLKETKDLMFPLNVLREIGMSLIGMFETATASYTPDEIKKCVKDNKDGKVCSDTKLNDLLTAIESNEQFAACSEDLENCQDKNLKDILTSLKQTTEKS